MIREDKSFIKTGKKIVCLRPKKDFEEFQAEAPSNFNVVYHSQNDDRLQSILKDAKVLLIPAVGDKISNRLLSGSTVELIQVTGAGIDRVDASYCFRNNIRVCNVLGASAHAVAEYCIFAAISLSRRLNDSSYKIADGEYVPYRNQLISDRMYSIAGLTVGIVGFGSIGRKTAHLFHSLGCRVQYFDTVEPVALSEKWSFAKKVDLKKLIESSDIVSLHVPLNKATEDLISFEELSSMKNSAVIINASRGGVVNEVALSEAILNNSIKGAATDVYMSEPPKEENPLLSLKKKHPTNLILTPHIAGVTAQSWTELFKRSWRNIQSFFDGEELENQQI